ncbi:MAG: PAS domain-containing protein [Pseudomonadota bacterium]
MHAEHDTALGDQQFIDLIGEDTDVVVSMVRNSRDCFKLLSADGYLLFMNARGIGIMEIDDVEQVMNRRWSSLWPSGQQDLIDQAVAKAARGEPVRFEGRCPTAKGRDAYWEVTVTPVTHKDGEIVQLLAVSRDITQRIALEEQVRAFEAEIERLSARERASSLVDSKEECLDLSVARV